MEWVRLTTTSDQISAELLVQVLRDEGINALVNAGDTASYFGVSSYPCRVMVNSDHWLQAMSLMETWESTSVEETED